mmetsp:Transcript_43925/g.73161  ORF Transcript_43925/g.73161 Transcript_43925/m.73161 type:complete len:101 (+) Transcript_43925:202-504(+)
MVNRRKDPPTPEEMERLAFQRFEMARKVAVLAEEDAKRRVRSRALKANEAAAPDMALLHSQVGLESGRAPNRDVNKKSDVDEEASGQGNSFQPGVWQPGK